MAYEHGGDSLFRSSIAGDADSEVVPHSQLLDMSYYQEKTVPAFDETDYSSEYQALSVRAGVWLRLFARHHPIT